MPEGPSIVILKEQCKKFEGKKILNASGNAAIDTTVLINKKLVAFKSWGKHFLICMPQLTIRIHMLLFGSYSIDERTKPVNRVRLHLQFKNGDIYFYSCSVKYLEEDPNSMYDWSADVMNPLFSVPKAVKKLKQMPHENISDALLNQEIFAGVGNIIKNEVLFRIKLHPENIIKNIPSKKLSELSKQAKEYSFDFLDWKKNFELRQHWQAYAKKKCPRCKIPLIKKYIGKTKRRTFFCTNCQILYK